MKSLIFLDSSTNLPIVVAQVINDQLVLLVEHLSECPRYYEVMKGKILQLDKANTSDWTSLPIAFGVAFIWEDGREA